MVLVPRRRPATDPAGGTGGGPRRGCSPSTSRPRPRRTATSRSRSTPRTVRWSTTSPSRWSGPTTARTSIPATRPTPSPAARTAPRWRSGFQVVLIVGQTDVIVPENLSAAANYNCVRCLTYALASQLVLTLDGPLSADGMARLNELWQQIADFGQEPAEGPALGNPGTAERLQAADHGRHQEPIPMRRPGNPVRHRPPHRPRRRARRRRSTPAAVPGGHRDHRRRPAAPPRPRPGHWPAHPSRTGPPARPPAGSGHAVAGPTATPGRRRVRTTADAPAQLPGAGPRPPDEPLRRGHLASAEYRQRRPPRPADALGWTLTGRRDFHSSVEDGVDDLRGPLALVVPFVHLPWIPAACPAVRTARPRRC